MSDHAIVEADTYRMTSALEMPRNLSEVIAIAKVMAASGFYPDAKTAQQAAAIMMIGVQFGIPPAQALTAIHIVKGKPMLHYSALLSKVRQHPDYDYEILESTAKLARVQFIRKDKPCGESVFTIEDAKRQGTQNMDKFPDTMLLARAVSNGVKRFCPDVLNGMPVYTPGEVEEAVYAPAGTKSDALRAELQASAPAALPEETEDMAETVEYVEQVLDEAELLRHFELTPTQIRTLREDYERVKPSQSFAEILDGAKESGLSEFDDLRDRVNGGKQEALL